MAPAGVVSVKSPEAFRTISEVAAMLDVPQHVLRFWETRFPQIKPVKRAGGRRFYRPEDVDLLRGIQLLLYYEGYTIRGAQKILREKGVRYTASLGREQKKNGHASPEPHIAAPVVDRGDPVAVTPLVSVQEEVGESSVEESTVVTAAPEIDPNLKLTVHFAEGMGANPRRVRLEAMRGELLELKYRLATARRRASTQ